MYNHTLFVGTTVKFISHSNFVEWKSALTDAGTIVDAARTLQKYGTPET